MVSKSHPSHQPCTCWLCRDEPIRTTFPYGVLANIKLSFHACCVSQHLSLHVYAATITGHHKDHWWLPSVAVLVAWWRHQMETFPALLDLCEGKSAVTGESPLLELCKGNSPVTGEFPSQRSSNVELWCFLWSAPEKMVEQTIKTPLIWEAIVLIMMSL